MIRIDDIKKLGFEITWEIVRLGWIGPGNFLRQLSVEEVHTFADFMVNEASDNELEQIAELCTTHDEQLIAEILSHLSPEINDRTVRIWRVALLKATISSLPDDPLYGLIGLTEFWSNFGYSSDSPHIIQGVDNDISPTDYYTQDNFDKALDNHREWLKKEIKKLIK